MRAGGAPLQPAPAVGGCGAVPSGGLSPSRAEEWSRAGAGGSRRLPFASSPSQCGLRPVEEAISPHGDVGAQNGGPSPRPKLGLAVTGSLVQEMGWVLRADCTMSSCWCVQGGCDTWILSVFVASPQGPGSQTVSWG